MSNSAENNLEARTPYSSSTYTSVMTPNAPKKQKLFSRSHHRQEWWQLRNTPKYDYDAVTEENDSLSPVTSNWITQMSPEKSYLQNTHGKSVQRQDVKRQLKFPRRAWSAEEVATKFYYRPESPTPLSEQQTTLTMNKKYSNLDDITIS